MGRQWPLPRGTFTISSRFAGRINPVTGQAESHSGTDFAAPDGTPFYACAGGTVQYIGAATGYGQWIVIDHPDSEGGGCTEYGHMWNAFATGLKQGQWVNAGQLIGYVGSNGQSTGAHLHLTVWERGYGGRRIDPETWLAGYPHPQDKVLSAVAKPATQPLKVRVATGKVLDWTRKFTFGSPRPGGDPTGICIHVTVNAPGTPAENVATYQINTQSGSYHELTDTTPTHLIENTDGWFVWAAGPTSNARHLHRSFVMWGTESRVDWLKYDSMLRDAAARDAAWAQKYNIPVVKITGADLRAGKKGFFGHLDAAQAWGETDHVDPGGGFPWDIYLGYVRDAMNGTTNKKESDVLTITFFTDFVKGFFGPVISDVKDIRQQITGGRDAGQYGGWSVSALVKNARAKSGDNATLPEMLALILTTQREMQDQINELKKEQK